MPVMDLSLLNEKELQNILNSNQSDQYCQTMIGKCHSAQNSIKVNGINSLYGALGSVYFNLFDVDMAESVTSTGRALIQYVAKRVNIRLNALYNTDDVDYVLYGDTDSIMVKLSNEDIDETEAINICNEVIKDEINETFKKLYNATNAFDDTCLEMGMEAIIKRGIMVKRKNYFFRIAVDEDEKVLDPPYEKISGLEAKKASKYSKFCRDKISHCYGTILDKDLNTLLDYTRNVFDEFTSFDIQLIANCSQVNNLDKYNTNFPMFEKGTPINSKAALTYNHYINKMGITERYPEIKEGDRIKFVKLKKNNKIHSSVIGWLGTELPEEFELEKYMDWEDLFYLNFLKPVERIAKAVGWNINLQSMTQLDLF